MKYETVATGFGLLEAPRVDDNGVVYFSDISGGGVFRVAPGGKPETVISIKSARAWAGWRLRKMEA